MALVSRRLLDNRDFQFWTLHLGGWIAWVLLFSLRDLQYANIGFSVLVIGACAGALLTFWLRYLYRAVWNHPVIVRIAVVLVVSFLVSAMWQPIKNYAQYIMNECHLTGQCPDLSPFNGLVGYSYYLIVSWSGLYFGIKYYQLLQEQRTERIKASSLAHQAQLRMLRYQLNPHFLFNTLNAISTMILAKNNSSANQMVGRLGSFLRYALDSDPMEKVSLSHEIETIKLYLDIEEVRFGDQLTVNLDIQDKAYAALVPSLLLQPLVENAIKYAFSGRQDGGILSISARVFADELLLELSDDGPGLDGPGLERLDGEFASKGVGIANILERLEEFYGEDHSCKFSDAEPRGLKVSMRIPFETEREMQRVAV